MKRGELARLLGFAFRHFALEIGHDLGGEAHLEVLAFEARVGIHHHHARPRDAARFGPS